MGIRFKPGEAATERPRGRCLQALGVLCAVISVLSLGAFWSIHTSEAEEWSAEQAIAHVLDAAHSPISNDTSVFVTANWRRVREGRQPAPCSGPRYVLPLASLEDDERRFVVSDLQGISVGESRDLDASGDAGEVEPTQTDGEDEE